MACESGNGEGGLGGGLGGGVWWALKWGGSWGFVYLVFDIWECGADAGTRYLGAMVSMTRFAWGSGG